MCLAIPVRITELLPDGMARAELDGVTMTIGVMMLDHVAIDDYVITHVGFAIARIDDDVPFSSYPEVDRIFTLIEGAGLDLDFDDRPSLVVHRLFVPHFYPCDVKTFCRLRAGPCRALNLFLRRGAWRARCPARFRAARPRW